MNVIEVHGLTKSFSRLRPKLVLDNLSFEISSGGVHGFLGPNGSGKTTTIRCLLGLVRTRRGALRVLGAEAPKQLHKVIARVGSFVETAYFSPSLTGLRNLELLCQIEKLPKSTAKMNLERVGLEEAAKQAFGKYSLGMKQRLGIAVALLKDPELLILDEPANGLDPAGITQMRDLIVDLGNQGRTIFLSSHNLSEVQMMCNRVVIISKGRCVFTGRIDEVASSEPKRQLFVVNDSARALEVLARAGVTGEVSPDGGGICADGRVSQISAALEAQGIEILGIKEVIPNLEDLFMRLTEGGDRAG